MVKIFSLPLKYCYPYRVVLHFVAYQLEGILCVSIHKYVRVWCDKHTYILCFLLSSTYYLLLILTEFCLVRFARLLYHKLYCRINVSIIPDFLSYSHLLTFYMSVRLLCDLFFKKYWHSVKLITGSDKLHRKSSDLPLTRMREVPALLLSPSSTVGWKWSTSVRCFFTVYLSSQKCYIFLERYFQVSKCEEYFTFLLCLYCLVTAGLWGFLLLF